MQLNHRFFSQTSHIIQFYWTIILPLFCLAAPAPVLAQYATIAGSILTEDGKPISDGVRIRWTQNGRQTSQFSDSGGQFSINFITPGQYTFEFEHVSTPETGKYEIIAGRSTSVNLAIVLLHPQADNPSHPSWQIKELPSGSPDAWQPERVLTESNLELLPNAKNLWSILSNTEGSVVTERFDVAGMNSHSQFLIGVRGSSWTQNQTLLNGLSVSHPTGDSMLFIPDLSAMEAVLYTIGDSPSVHTGPGAHISMIQKTGGRKLHGEAFSYLQCGAFQNVNPTERNLFFGIMESDERWKHYFNGGVQLGGPLGKLPWTYFGAFSVRDIEKRIRNHALPVSANTIHESFNLKGELSPKDQLGLYWSEERLHEPQTNASPQITRESSLDQKQNYQSVQSAWTRFISSKSIFDVRFGAALGRVDSGFQPNISGQSREDVFPGYGLYKQPGTPYYLDLVAMMSNTMTGPAPLANSSDSSSMQASASFSTVRKGWRNSSHSASAGVSFSRKSITQDYAAIDAINLLFFDKAPDSVRMLNTPAHTQDRVNLWEFHASERFSIGRLSVALGASASISSGANILASGQTANVLQWTNTAGRLGAAYRVMTKYPLILRASAAQIHNQPLAGVWNAVNPNGLGSRTYQWTDSNADGLFQKGENPQLLKASGSPYARMDPDLKNPKTLEVSLGLRQGLPWGFALHVSGYRRFEHNLMSLINEGVPFSSYTPVQVLDPGPNSEMGDQDDRYLTVYNQAIETLGRDRYVLTNPSGFKGFAEGMELKLSFSTNKIQGEAVMVRNRAVAATAPGISARENDTSVLLGVYDDPNKAIFARGSTYFDRGTVGRLWLASMLPWKIRWSMLVNYQDGLPYSRYLPIKGLNQGLIGVLTGQRGPGAAGTKGGIMTAHYETIDARFTKDIFLRLGKLSATLDIFNLTNRAQPLLQMAVTAPTHLWRIPLRFETPRSLQLGLKYKW